MFRCIQSMPKHVSRKLACICASAVAAYMACFLLLWNEAITVQTQYLTFGGRKITRDMLNVEDMFILRGDIRNFGNASARTYAHSRTDTEDNNQLSVHKMCIDRACFNNSSMNSSTKKYIETTERNNVGSKKYFLTEIIMVRIYRNDLAKWTIKELKQWMHFLFYVGVEHVYLCDHFIYDHERLESSLSRYIKRGLLTYIEWPWNASSNGGNIMKHQVNCYDHVIRKYGMDSVWQMSIDMDEFPVCLNDTEGLFLVRFLKQKPARVSQILMPNFLMLGQGNRSKTMTIERITRITKKTANALTKPIYRTSSIRHPDIHRHFIGSGLTITASTQELRMLHYWGARLQNWGQDTNKTIEVTDEFDLAKDMIAAAIRKDLIEFDEYDAFSNVTGP